MSKFKAGDVCYFDDDKGEVLEIYLADRGPDSFNLLVKWDNNVVTEVWESDLLTQAEYDAFYGEAECNGICLSGADLGVPEYGGIAYAHPDCPEHGDPLDEHDEADVCDAWGQENLRYVREEDVEV